MNTLQIPDLYLLPQEERRLLGGHLWIFSNEIDNKRSPLKSFVPGEQVRVRSHTDRLIGTAYVNPHTLLCARLISRGAQLLDTDLLEERLKQALALRERLFTQPFYRLVYGESDLLPGLVVDRFGDHLSVQLNTAGMEKIRDSIIDSLCRLVTPRSILLRNDSSVRILEGLESKVEIAFGSPPEEVELVENGVRMVAPLRSGQKTGWFYDQRPNRAWLKHYVSGGRLLDVFSYAGGFAILGGVCGATGVVAVDASLAALEMAEKNALLNNIGDRFTGLQGDAFEVLKGLYADGDRFEVIVVDPPAFIKRKKDHKEGMRAYRRINELALRLLSPGGFLLSASCSMHLHRDELLEVLRGAGQSLGRHLQILQEGMQGPDHPVHPAISETRYLKAFMARASTL